MRNGVNGSTILGLNHSTDNPIECEKRAKKVIVKKPVALMWVMNLILPISSLTMPYLHNSTTMQPIIEVTAVDMLTHTHTHTHTQTKHSTAAMTRSMPDSSVHCNVAHK